jgi:hypothetical protein
MDGLHGQNVMCCLRYSLFEPEKNEYLGYDTDIFYSFRFCLPAGGRLLYLQHAVWYFFESALSFQFLHVDDTCNCIQFYGYKGTDPFSKSLMEQTFSFYLLDISLTYYL